MPNSISGKISAYALGVEDDRTTSLISGIVAKTADVSGLVSYRQVRKTGVMSKTIKLSIKARGETDSPTVDDFLDQVRDYFEILEGVEQAIAENGAKAIEWRIVRATTSSPIALEAQAYPVMFATNIDQRVELVTRQTAIGMQQLRTERERPPYFTDKVLARAEKFFERVTNGLETTIVDFGDDLPKLELTPAVARQAAANTRSLLEPPDKPYNELGSVEGAARSIDSDGRGRLILWIHSRLTGEEVKCLVSGEAADELGEHQIREVWRGRRVQVYGTLRFRGLGKLQQVEAIKIRFLRDRSDLPGVDDIYDPNFTGGMRSEDYLARLRDEPH